MNTADRNLWLDRIESLKRFATWANLAIVVLIVALLGAYCAGKSRGAQAQKDKAFEVAHAAVVDTIRGTETKLVHDTVTVRVTKIQADTARQAYSAAEATLEAAAARSDSVASGAVIPALHACDAVIQADSIAYRAVVVALTDMTTDRDAWKSRAELDEAHVVKPSRFGFKSGAASATAVILIIMHFLR